MVKTQALFDTSKEDKIVIVSNMAELVLLKPLNNS